MPRYICVRGIALRKLITNFITLESLFLSFSAFPHSPHFPLPLPLPSPPLPRVFTTCLSVNREIATFYFR